MGDLVEVIGQGEAIVEIRLNRPEKKNAVTLDLLDQLVAAGEGLAAQKGLRAVILSGAGGDFSAGMDTSMFMAMAGMLDDLKRQMLDLPEGVTANRFQRPAQIWQDLPVPVIAVIDGVCLGAGVQIALGADFRFASPSSRLSIMEAKWGLIPDMGLSLSLPRLMPADRAKALVMTGRMLSGEEALAEGLVTRVADDPLTAARAFAEELAGKSPEGTRHAKRLIDTLWSTGREQAHLALEAQLQADLMGSPNQIETAMAQIQKRKPNYL